MSLLERGPRGQYLPHKAPALTSEQRKTYGRSGEALSPKQCDKCKLRGQVDVSKRYDDYIYRRYKCKCNNRWTTYEFRIDQKDREDEEVGTDIRLTIREHIETCESCSPLAACMELLALHQELIKEELAYQDRLKKLREGPPVPFTPIEPKPYTGVVYQGDKTKPVKQPRCAYCDEIAHPGKMCASTDDD